MTDLTRKKDYAEKKTRSVAAARVLHGDVADTSAHELFNLPANCLITDAFVVVDVVGQDTLTVDFGFDGGDELGDALDVHDATGVVSTPLQATVDGDAETVDIDNQIRILTGTGKTVTALFSADPSAGDFTFIVEYIEYTLGNGKLTEASRA